MEIDVSCAIIIKDEKILVTQRSEKMNSPLKWEFPGGKIEKEESAQDCLIREIKEELNIKIKIIKRLSNSVHDYGNFKINLIPFIASYVSGEVILAEHKAYKLLPKAALETLDWADADLPIMREFLKDKI